MTLKERGKTIRSFLQFVEVENDLTVEDKRKTRKVFWKEARLCFCCDRKKVKAIFHATLRSTDKMKDLWFSSAISAGMRTSTSVHCVGEWCGLD